MDINYEKKIIEMQRIVKKLVKPSRYEHSIRTAETAEELCQNYGINSRKGYLTGLIHDICKDIDEKEMYSLAKTDGLSFNPLELKNKVLLHGRAAAVLLRNEYNINESDILEAVREHTYGKPGMCDLAKILYIADKCEPGRPHITGELSDKYEGKTLDKFLISILEENIRYLNEMGYDIMPQTEEFLLSLSGGVKNA